MAEVIGLVNWVDRYGECLGWLAFYRPFSNTHVGHRCRGYRERYLGLGVWRIVGLIAFSQTPIV